MIRLYHAPATRSLRILWLLEELGVPYEVAPVDFRRFGTRAGEIIARATRLPYRRAH